MTLKRLKEVLERAQICFLNNGQGKEKWLEDFKEEYDYKA